MFGRRHPPLLPLPTVQGLARMDTAGGVAPADGRRGVAEPITGPGDCCPAAAAVRVRLTSGAVLLLCGHHGRHHAAALLLQDAELTGELQFTGELEFTRTRPPAPVREW